MRKSKSESTAEIAIVLADDSSMEAKVEVPYRDPDHVLTNAKQELQRLTKGAYQENSGTRAIAPYLRLDRSNRSHSFNVLVSSIRDLVLSK